MACFPRRADHDRVPRLSSVVASNIRAERARRHWDQTELGRRIGWSRSTVSAIESGQRKITLDHLAPLCRAFGIPLTKLTEGADPEDLRVLGF